VVARISLDDPLEGADHHSIATLEPASLIASTGKNNLSLNNFLSFPFSNQQ